MASLRSASITAVKCGVVVSFGTSITLAGRAADPLRPHPCDDDRRLAVAGLDKVSLLSEVF